MVNQPPNFSHGPEYASAIGLKLDLLILEKKDQFTASLAGVIEPEPHQQQLFDGLRTRQAGVSLDDLAQFIINDYGALIKQCADKRTGQSADDRDVTVAEQCHGYVELLRIGASLRATVDPTERHSLDSGMLAPAETEQVVLMVWKAVCNNSPENAARYAKLLELYAVNPLSSN